MPSLNELLAGMTFGVELECYGEDRNGAIARAALATGGRFSNEGVVLPDGRLWVAKGDCSIEPRRPLRQIGLEMASPICTYQDLPMVQSVTRALWETGYRVNNSCGLHVHVGVPGLDALMVRALLGFWHRFQDNLIVAAGTEGAGRLRYAQRLPQAVLEKARDLQLRHGLGNVAGLWYAADPARPHPGAVLNGGASRHSDTRYRSLNLHSAFVRGTVEFRLWNGTLHAGKVRAAVVDSMAIVALAARRRDLETVTALERRPAPVSLEVWRRCLRRRLGLTGPEARNVIRHLCEAHRAAVAPAFQAAEPPAATAN